MISTRCTSTRRTMPGVRLTLAAALLAAAGLPGPALADERTEDGWTILKPSPDTRFVFVSSSEGDDRNSGRSPGQAVKTIARGKELMRNDSTDWMLLRKGDTWHEVFNSWKFSGRSPDERVVITTYGESHERPKIVCQNAHGITAPYGEDVSHVAIVGLHFVSDRAVDNVTRGVRWQSTGEDLLIEDCKIEGFASNITIEGLQPGFENATIRRTIIADAWTTGGHSQGLFAKDVTGLVLEENVIDHNGWNPDIPGAEATTFNQNVYLQVGVTGVVFSGNVSARAAGAGVQMRSGGIAENNLFYANDMAMRFGYPSLDWPSQAATGLIKNNVVVGGPLARETDQVFGIWTERLLDVVIEGNVVTSAVGPGQPVAFTLGGNAERVVMRNNTAYHWTVGNSGQALKMTADTVNTIPGSVTVRDNRWIMPGTTRVVNIRTLGMIAFWNNDFQGISPSENVFQFEGRNANLQGWIDTPNVTQDELTTLHLHDEGRTLGDYARMLGFADEAAFLAAARNISRDEWRPELTGTAASAWIRSGYAIAD